MKNSFALLALATLLVGTSGCGCCRGLFSKSAAPVATYSQYAPSCRPSCDAGPSCGCATGTPVTYGFDGGGATAYESAPMSFPTGSGTSGQ